MKFRNNTFSNLQIYFFTYKTQVIGYFFSRYLFFFMLNKNDKRMNYQLNKQKFIYFTAAIKKKKDNSYFNFIQTKNASIFINIFFKQAKKKKVTMKN